MDWSAAVSTHRGYFFRENASLLQIRVVLALALLQNQFGSPLLLLLFICGMEETGLQFRICETEKQMHPTPPATTNNIKFKHNTILVVPDVAGGGTLKLSEHENICKHRHATHVFLRISNWHGGDPYIPQKKAFSYELPLGLALKHCCLLAFFFPFSVVDLWTWPFLKRLFMASVCAL